jgi:hypothetical protein
MVQHGRCGRETSVRELQSVQAGSEAFPLSGRRKSVTGVGRTSSNFVAVRSAAVEPSLQTIYMVSVVCGGKAQQGRQASRLRAHLTTDPLIGRACAAMPGRPFTAASGSGSAMASPRLRFRPGKSAKRRATGAAISRLVLRITRGSSVQRRDTGPQHAQRRRQPAAAQGDDPQTAAGLGQPAVVVTGWLAPQTATSPTAKSPIVVNCGRSAFPHDPHPHLARPR